jgi:hypothetical protein
VIIASAALFEPCGGLGVVGIPGQGCLGVESRSLGPFMYLETRITVRHDIT